uniref:Uncharacterized protein n=1 Tax=Myoviridae sp. ctI7W9 TaxID=2826636 RepID=A0A8S5MNE9_9CAUD|nr:MAG TPA: hypothetical protein [Myoviridae sp. ctI7W9]
MNNHYIENRIAGIAQHKRYAKTDKALPSPPSEVIIPQKGNCHG